MIEKFKYNYVYEITNVLNGKIYVGKHSTDDLEDGYMGSGSCLQRAMKRDGKQNFKKKILSFFENENEAIEYERQILTEEFVKRQNTYNRIAAGATITHKKGKKQRN